MSLRVESKFPGGSVGGVNVDAQNDPPEVFFSANPSGGAECLWFNFRLTEDDLSGKHPDKVTLTLRFLRNLLGTDSPTALRPVLRSKGQNWMRGKAGTVQIAPDGQKSLSWTIPYPAPTIDVALCFPYGRSELHTRMQKSKGYWSLNEIGLSQGAHPLPRLSNDYGSHGSGQSGLYLIARQHAGETPGSWVMDGMLDYFSRKRDSRLLVWAVPFVDVDAVERDYYGKSRLPFDPGLSWSSPPLRHETLAIQQDVAEWRTRCRPLLMLDFRAPGGTDTNGIYTSLPPATNGDAPARELEKWANVISEELGSEYAAEDFKRVSTDTGEAPTFSSYARKELGIDAMTIEAPYALCGKTLMTTKQYREVGHRIARAILKRAKTIQGG
jgi:hypothetical protein